MDLNAAAPSSVLQIERIYLLGIKEDGTGLLDFDQVCCMRTFSSSAHVKLISCLHVEQNLQHMQNPGSMDACMCSTSGKLQPHHTVLVVQVFRLDMKSQDIRREAVQWNTHKTNPMEHVMRIRCCTHIVISSASPLVSCFQSLVQLLQPARVT